MHNATGWIALAALGVVAACTPSNQAGSDPTTAATSDTPRILVTGEDGSVSIVTLGGSTSQIIDQSEPSLAVQPTPSADGEAIAYTGVGESGDPVGVIWSEAGTTIVEFGFSPFFYSWSPDGSRLIALGNGDTGVDGAIADVTSAEVTPLGSGVPFFVAWSPDSKRLATNRDSTDLDLVDLDGAAAPIGSDAATFQAPDWLSDDEIVVAVVGSTLEASVRPLGDEAARIVLLAADGGSRDLLSVSPISQFDLDPSRQRLAVLDGPPADGRLRTLELATGEVTIVDVERVVTFEWSPDGSRLLTMSIDGNQLKADVWVGATREHTYAPFTPTQTFVAQYLPFWGQYVRTVKTWAPDGSAFVYASTTPDGDTVSVHRLDAEEAENVGPGSMAQWLP